MSSGERDPADSLAELVGELSEAGRRSRLSFVAVGRRARRGFWGRAAPVFESLPQDPPAAEAGLIGEQDGVRLDDVVVVGGRDVLERLSFEELDALLADDVSDILRELRRRSGGGAPRIRLNGQLLSNPELLNDFPAEMLDSAALRETALGPEISLTTRDGYGGWRAQVRADIGETVGRVNGEAAYSASSARLLLNVLQSAQATTVAGRVDQDVRTSLSSVDLSTDGRQRTVSAEWRVRTTEDSGLASRLDDGAWSLGQSLDLGQDASWQVNGGLSASRLTLNGRDQAATDATTRSLLAETRLDGLRPFGTNDPTTALVALTLQRFTQSDQDEDRGLLELGAARTAPDRRWSARVTQTGAVIGPPERALDVEAVWRPFTDFEVRASALTQVRPPSFEEADERLRFVGILRDTPGVDRVEAYVGADADLSGPKIDTVAFEAKFKPISLSGLELGATWTRRETLDPIVTLTGRIEDWSSLFPERLTPGPTSTIARLGPFNLSQITSKSVELRARYVTGWPMPDDRLEVEAATTVPCAVLAVTRDGRRLSDGELSRAFGLDTVAGRHSARFGWTGSDWAVDFEYGQVADRAPVINARLERRFSGLRNVSIEFGAANLLGTPTATGVGNAGALNFDDAPRIWISLRHAPR